jgi:hypothetical protein
MEIGEESYVMEEKMTAELSGIDKVVREPFRFEK